MKTIRIILASLIVSILSTGNAIAYTVKSGETLSSIAKQHNTSWQLLAKLNDLVNPSLIYPNQEILVPDDFDASPMFGGSVTKPYTFSPNTIIRSSEVNANFDTLYTLVNGNIENVNIKSNAAIDPTKISGTAIVSTPSSAQTINGTTTHFGQFVVSTTAGYFRVNQMTGAQRLALTPDNGAIVYDTSAGQFMVYEGGAWSGFTAAAITATSSLTGKGVVELGTGAEAAAHAAAGSGHTDAPLALHTGISSSTSDVNIVPVTNASSVLHSSFGGSANSLATLDANTLVVQNPANATSTPTANKIPIADASSTLNSWVKGKFGGDGSDGALSITSGTTTINLGGAAIVEKNYTSISITGTGALAFSNPNANGTKIILRSQGNCDLTSSAAPMIDASGMGAASSTQATSLESTSKVGTAGADGEENTATGGAGGSTYNGGFSLELYTTTAAKLNNRYIGIFPGSGGAAGGNGISGSGGSNGVGGVGGRGGAALIIECAGAWNFTTANGISVAGADGTNGTNGSQAGASQWGSGGGGGSGGRGGTFLGLYNSLTANSGTINISSGRGGNGGNGASGNSSGVDKSGGAGGGTSGGISGAGTAGGSSFDSGSPQNGSSGSGAGGGPANQSTPTTSGGTGGSPDTSSGLSIIAKNVWFF